MESIKIEGAFDFSEDEQDLFSLINSENSDFAKALVTASHIEAYLEILLKENLKGCKESKKLLTNPMSSISSFAGKTNLAYCMSIIDEAMFKCLNQIREIRNKFAHSKRNLSFNDREIGKLCKQLNYSIHQEISIPSDYSVAQKNRTLFMFSALALWSGLRKEAYKAHNRKKQQ